MLIYRRIAQLVESRSPKPLVVGSSPTSPAITPTQMSITNDIKRDENNSSLFINSP